MAHKAVFLDRDNTIIEDPGYLADPKGVKLLPGVEHALKRLHSAGWLLVVVTNQSGVARGLLSEEVLQDVHAEVQRQLAQHGAALDGIYYCPYLPNAPVEAYARDSDERKPHPGMLLRAAREMDLDLQLSWMVGDSPRDVEAGRRAGCRTIRIRHGEWPGAAKKTEEDEDSPADFTVRNLAEAVAMILRQSNTPLQANAPAAARPSSPNPQAPPGPVKKILDQRRLRIDSRLAADVAQPRILSEVEGPQAVETLTRPFGPPSPVEGRGVVAHPAILSEVEGSEVEGSELEMIQVEEPSAVETLTRSFGPPSPVEGRGVVAQPPSAVLETSPVAVRPAAPPAAPTPAPSPKPMETDSEVLRELLQLARQHYRANQGRDFSISKLIAGLCQGLAVLAFVWGVIKFISLSTIEGSSFWFFMGYMAIAGFCQLAALTFFLMNRQD